MNREFTLDGQQVEMKCTGATAYRFKQVFKSMDILKTLSNEKELMEHGTDHAIRLMYIMAMQAQEKDFAKLNENTFMEWLDNFSTGTLIDNVDLAVAFFQETKTTTSTPKNQEGQPPESTTQPSTC